MRKMRVVLLGAALAMAGCATTASVEALYAADRAFAAEAAAKGLQAAFTDWAAEDAWVLKAGGPARGKAEVERTFAGTENVELSWQPVGAELAAGGDVGWTWGTWSRRLKSDTTAAPRQGRYLTTWRRTPAGYRWTADLGDQDPAK